MESTAVSDLTMLTGGTLSVLMKQKSVDLDARRILMDTDMKKWVQGTGFKDYKFIDNGEVWEGEWFKKMMNDVWRMPYPWDETPKKVQEVWGLYGKKARMWMNRRKNNVIRTMYQAFKSTYKIGIMVLLVPYERYTHKSALFFL